MALKTGRVSHDIKRGRVRWYLEFPGYPRIYGYPLGDDKHAQFPTDDPAKLPPDRKPGRPARGAELEYPGCVGRMMAKTYLGAIQGQLSNGVPLDVALAPYLNTVSERHRVRTRWEEFVQARHVERLQGRKISDHRLRELKRMPERGYLDFFDEHKVSSLSLDSLCLKRWVGWMFERWPPRPEKATPAQRAELLARVNARWAEARAAAEKGTTVPRRKDPRAGFHGLNTRHHIVNDFMQFCGWLVSEQILREMPAKPKLPDLEETPVVVPTEEELDRYLAAIPEAERGLWLARGRMGLRPEEARELQVKHYLPAARDRSGEVIVPAFLRIEFTKTTAGKRPLALDWELEDWLEAHVPLGAVRFTPERLLFQNPRAETPEGAWTDDAERRVHVAAIEASGIPYYPPNHMGRHATATHLADREVPIDVTQQILGHTDARTTARFYVHQRERAQLARTERIARPRPGAPRRTAQRDDT